MPVDVVLDIPIELNSIVDFNLLAEAKYGFENVHPSVATVDDLLFDDDGDDNENDNDDPENDIDLDNDNGNDNDIDNDNDNENDIGDDNDPANETYDNDNDAEQDDDENDDDMAPGTGQNGDGSNFKSSKKPRRKLGKYDLNDPFIDDAEMEWESTSAATKDGFFVYSGVIEVDVNEEKEKEKKTAKRKKEAEANVPVKKRKYVKKKDKIAAAAKEATPKAESPTEQELTRKEPTENQAMQTSEKQPPEVQSTETAEKTGAPEKDETNATAERMDFSANEIVIDLASTPKATDTDADVSEM